MADALFDELIKRAAMEHSNMLVQQAPQQQTSEGPGKLAWATYLAGLGADVGTTAYGAHKGLTEEANPLMKAFGNKGAAPMVAGTSVLSALLAKKFLGKKHPKILKGLLMGMGGAHGAAAVSNLGQMGKARQQQDQMMTPGRDPNTPPFPGAVRLPDGSWINPDLFN